MFVGVLLALAIGLTQSGNQEWGRSAVRNLTEAGVEVSFPDGSFLGDGTLTGYQAAILVDRLLSQIDVSTGCPDLVTGLPDGEFDFGDVPEGHWAAGAARRVAALGVRQAFPDGNLH